MRRGLAAALLFLAAPALADAVSGTVGYLEPVPPPVESVLAVRLVDVAATPPVVLAEMRRLALGGPPFAFSLEVDPLLLGERRRQLRLVAAIEAGGRAWMRTEAPYRLEPASFAAPVTLDLAAVGTTDEVVQAALSCRAADGAWRFELEGRVVTFATPAPSVERWRGSVTLPANDRLVWRGGTALGGTVVALARAEACADGPWSLVLVGADGAVRQGCCAAAP